MPSLPSIFCHTTSTTSLSTMIPTPHSAVPTDPYFQPLYKPLSTHFPFTPPLHSPYTPNLPTNPYPPTLLTLPKPLLTQILTNDLVEVCAANHSITINTPISHPIFSSSYAQPFSLHYYISRLLHYIPCSNSVFIVALIYLDRLQLGDKFVLLCDKNIHRFLLTAVVLANKFVEDVNVCQGFYAKCGGVSLDELNRLEERMLKLLDWNLNVDLSTYNVYQDNVMHAWLNGGVEHACGMEGSPILSEDEDC